MKRPTYLVLLLTYIFVLCLIVFILFLLLNNRSKESFYYEGYSDHFIIPQIDTIVPPLISELHLRGFDVKISQIQSGGLGIEKGKEILILKFEIDIEANPLRHTDQTSMTAAISGKMGEGSMLILPAGTLISGGLMQNDDPVLAMTMPQNSRSEFVLFSEGINLKELNRLIPAVDLPEKIKQVESFSLRLKPQDGRLIKASFFSQDDTLQKTVTILLRDKEKALTQARERLEFSFAEGLVRMEGAYDPVLKIDAFDAPGQPKGIPLSVGIKGEMLEAVCADIKLDERMNKWMLKWKVEGMAESIEVQGHELVQTKFEKIMGGEMGKKSIWGIGIMAVTFIIVAFFKRAIEGVVEEVFNRKDK